MRKNSNMELQLDKKNVSCTKTLSKYKLMQVYVDLHEQFSGFHSFIFNLNSSTLFLLNSFFFLSYENAVHFPQRFRSWKVATTHSLPEIIQ